MNRHKEALTRALTQFMLQQEILYKEEVFAQTLINIRQCLLSGKMFRGLLFLGVVDPLLKEQEKREPLFNMAMSIEMVHTAFLIHDDIMDRSSLRRGEETIHMFWQKKAKERGQNLHSSEHYGFSQAICVGDIVLFLAQQLFMQSLRDLGSWEMGELAIKEWNKVCFSQMVDMDLGARSFKEDIPIKQILDVYKGKTARYTFCLPLLLGGMALLAPEPILYVLERVGESAGIAFQLQDDYLDLFGEEKKVKKTLGQDIREGKKTFALSLLYRKFNTQEKTFFEGLVHKKNLLKETEISWVQEQLREKGIIKESERIIGEYKQNIEENLGLLKDYPWVLNLFQGILKDMQKRSF